MTKSKWSDLLKLEDWWAIWLGFALLATVFSGAIAKVPKMPSWSWGAFGEAWSATLVGQIAILALGFAALYGVGVAMMNPGAVRRFVPAFFVLFALATLAYVVANEKTVKAYGLSYAMWALIIGLLISNTIGVPGWLKSGVRTEFYIKTGLVIMGAEILLSKILSFGIYGILIAWAVTPIVIVFMWLFGTRVLRMTNKHMVIIVATATSVCGVSAAIAAAAACRAKKEDLTVAVGMTLIFTVIMMIVMPAFIGWVGMDPVIGGAWMGGTIDATGAVVAAGAVLGPEAEAVAAIVKMIQNVLIGVVAFCIAAYWVARVDREPGAPRPSLTELWVRFPKFILGFVAASLIASLVIVPWLGLDFVDAAKSQTKVFRGWLFCMAFLSIGLESNFKQLAKQLVGGKPILLYLTGQTFNIALTLIIAWIVLSGLILPAPESTLAGP